MKKVTAIAIALGVAAAGAASAHPLDLPFDSFGECTAALNQLNKAERERVGWFFPSNGAAEVSMLNDFSCEYNPEDGLWYFEGFPLSGDNLGNGNGKAEPGADRP